MILYYALGSGLGHLTRARAVINSLSLGPEVTILTDSRHEIGSANVVRMPVELSDDRAQAAAWLRGQIGELAPSEFYLDAFPCGLLGELDADFWCESLSNLPITHLARLLRFDRYKTVIPERPIKLNRTLILEELTPEHRLYVDALSLEVHDFGVLHDPSDVTPPQALELLQRHPEFWLVVHLGSDAELRRLVDYAHRLQKKMADQSTIVVVSDKKISVSGVVSVSIYPADALFDSARQIITACGFNSMRQLERYSDKHFFLPFERVFDDQYTRAGRRLCRILSRNDDCDKDLRLSRIWLPRRNAAVVTTLTEEGYAELYDCDSGAVCTLPPIGALLWELSDGTIPFIELSGIVREAIEDSGGDCDAQMLEGLVALVLQMTDKGFLAD